MLRHALVMEGGMIPEVENTAFILEGTTTWMLLAKKHPDCGFVFQGALLQQHFGRMNRLLETVSIIYTHVGRGTYLYTVFNSYDLSFSFYFHLVLGFTRYQERTAYL